MQIKIKIENGLISDGKELVRNALKSASDGFYMLTIDKWSKKRTEQQNAYYGFTLTETAKEFGGTSKEWHQIFKQMFLVVRTFKAKNGDVYRVVKSTTKLNTVEFGEYLDSIFEKLKEMGLNIPEPRKWIDDVRPKNGSREPKPRE